MTQPRRSLSSILDEPLPGYTKYCPASGTVRRDDSSAELPLTAPEAVQEPSPSRVPTDPRAKDPRFTRALSLLDMDEIGQYGWVCFACGIFHQRKKDTLYDAKNRRKKARVEDEYHCKHYSQKFPENIRIDGQKRTWLTFHLVVRALQYAKEDELSWFPDLHSPGTWRSVAHDVKAMLVDGRLLLRERSWDGIGLKKERKQSFGLFHHMCPHLKYTNIKNSDANHVLNGAVKHLQETCKEENAGGFVYKTYRCNQCPFEITVEVCCASLFDGKLGRRERMKGYVMSVNRYMDLGKCRSPDEIEWRALTTWYRRSGETNLRTYRDSSKYAPKHAKNETEVPDEERPRIDVTGWTRICERFEGLGWPKVPLLPGHDLPWVEPPDYLS